VIIENAILTIYLKIKYLEKIFLSLSLELDFFMKD
jgi:hypothetical protein